MAKLGGFVFLNKTRIARRFADASATYDAHALAQQRIQQHLLHLLSQHAPEKWGNVLEIGCGTATLSQQFIQRFQTASLTLNDLNAQYETLIRQKMPSETHLIFGDAEQIDLGSGYDLIMSASAIQWFADHAAFLQRASNMLTPQGWLLFNTFTTDNLHEIRSLTGIGLNYPDHQTWQNWLNLNYAVIELSSEPICLSFQHPLAVLHHLRNTGVTSISTSSWTKKRLQAFIQQYQQQFSHSDGLVSLSYTPLYVLAQKK